MNKSSLYAYIQFIGNVDFPLDVVTERLSVQPTKTGKVGERVMPDYPINKLVHRGTSWRYEIDTIETLDSTEVLHPLLEIFQSKTETINKLKDEFNLDVILALVIQIYDGQTPGLVVDPEFSKFASEIKAFLDIDMYVYPFIELEE